MFTALMSDLDIYIYVCMYVCMYVTIYIYIYIYKINIEPRVESREPNLQDSSGKAVNIVIFPLLYRAAKLSPRDDYMSFSLNYIFNYCPLVVEIHDCGLPSGRKITY